MSPTHALRYRASVRDRVSVKHAQRKHARYDKNGRMITRGSGDITWYSYDLPSVVEASAGTDSSQFWYAADRSRFKQRVLEGASDTTIGYVGRWFETEDDGSNGSINRYRHYVHAGSRVVAMVERDAATHTNTTEYLHRDHQGSVTRVTNASGSQVEALAYDPWGLRRDPADWSSLGSPFAGSHDTERGYTGHEHLDAVGLVHMNGRVQDPTLGRFISADPFIQAPYFTQSHNRYSYVMNNPASLVDPSGFWWDCNLLGCVSNPDPRDWSPERDGTLINYEPGPVFSDWDDMLDFYRPTFSDYGPCSFSGCLHSDVWLDAFRVKNDLMWDDMDAQIEAVHRPYEPRWFEGIPILGEMIEGLGDQISLVYRINGYRVNPFTRNILSQREINDADVFTFVDVGTLGTLGTARRLNGVVSEAAERLTNNKLRGDAARDNLADRLSGSGLDVETEVSHSTPFGRRQIDIEVSRDGNVLGGIEVKTGDSRYHPSQRSKDEWLRRQGYPVDLVRDP